MIILRTVKNISSLNIAASVLLFLAAILAAVVANSSLSPVYQDFLLQELNRDGRTIIPRGQTRLHSGDKLLLVTLGTAERDLRRILRLKD